MNSGNLRFAKLISYLFHPLFMPSLGTVYLYLSSLIPGFNLYSSEQDNWLNVQVIILVITFSFLLPLLAVIYLKKQNKIQSFQMESKEERILPFTITGLSVFTAYYLIFSYFNFSVNPIIQVFLLGSLLSIIVGLTITLRWKISVHMIGIGGFTGSLFLMNALLESVLFYELIIAVFLAGFIAYSRLTLKAHDISQIVAGFVVGFFCETFFLFFY